MDPDPHRAPRHVDPKAVAYLILGAVVTVIGILLMRVRLHTTLTGELTGELIYEIAQTQIAEQGLPTKAINRWFPYVASLFLFIFVINFVVSPLPLSDETFTLFGVKLPTLAIYAAIVARRHADARAPHVHLHPRRGVRHNGPVRYFKSWIPDVPPALLPLIVPLEILVSSCG